MMKKYNSSSQASAPRKSLRERVADRKAGIKPEMPPARKKIMTRMKLLANILQGIGLIMLFVVLGQFIKSGYAEMNWVNVTVYSGMFLVGRAGLAVLTLMKSMR